MCTPCRGAVGLSQCAARRGLGHQVSTFGGGGGGACGCTTLEHWMTAGTCHILPRVSIESRQCQCWCSAAGCDGVSEKHAG